MKEIEWDPSMKWIELRDNQCNYQWALVIESTDNQIQQECNEQNNPPQHMIRLVIDNPIDTDQSILRVKQNSDRLQIFRSNTPFYY